MAEHEVVSISAGAWDEIRRKMIAQARWGGVIDDRVPELEMDGIVLRREQPISFRVTDHQFQPSPAIHDYCTFKIPPRDDSDFAECGLPRGRHESG